MKNIFFVILFAFFLTPLVSQASVTVEYSECASIENGCVTLTFTDGPNTNIYVWWESYTAGYLVKFPDESSPYTVSADTIQSNAEVDGNFTFLSDQDDACDSLDFAGCQAVSLFEVPFEIVPSGDSWAFVYTPPEPPATASSTPYEALAGGFLQIILIPLSFLLAIILLFRLIP